MGLDYYENAQHLYNSIKKKLLNNKVISEKDFDSLKFISYDSYLITLKNFETIQKLKLKEIIDMIAFNLYRCRTNKEVCSYFQNYQTLREEYITTFNLSFFEILDDEKLNKYIDRCKNRILLDASNNNYGNSCGKIPEINKEFLKKFLN